MATCAVPRTPARFGEIGPFPACRHGGLRWDGGSSKCRFSGWSAPDVVQKRTRVVIAGFLVAKSVRAAEAIRANPGKSDRGIAAAIGVDHKTVGAARQQSRGECSPPDRIGQDGKSYSIRQRITDDPDISPKLAHEAAATGRRRVFLRCAEDAIRKAEQGAGLKDAKESEIDEEILMTLDKVIKAWTSLRDEILNRKGEG
jgi:hypothetical protein